MLPDTPRAPCFVRRRRPGLRGPTALLAMLIGVWVSAAGAEPYMTQLEWIHPDPETLAHFEVLFAFSAEERERPTALPVGKPLEVDRFVWPIQVPAESSVWVAVVAVGSDGQRSEPTEWRRYDWQPGQGPLDLPGRPYLVDETKR
jgi:hypothetical protein